MGSTCNTYFIQDNSWTVDSKTEILREKSHKKGGQSSARFQANRECQMRDYSNLISSEISRLSKKGPTFVFGNKDMINLLPEVPRGCIKKITGLQTMSHELLRISLQEMEGIRRKELDKELEDVLSDISTNPDYWYIGPEVSSVPEWEYSSKKYIILSPESNTQTIFYNTTGGITLKGRTPKSSLESY